MEAENAKVDFLVARRHDPTGPTLPTLKRLFAHSGNRCAFPRCTASLIDGSTVVGKVCHIKGARPGSARYDAQQSAAERHGFDNLILMCGRHHDVIDADEETYTVDRLFKLKADHQARAARIDESLAEQAAYLLINQPVTSANQSGGITAHTVRADTINLYTSPATQTSRPSWQLLPVEAHPSSFMDDGQTLCRPRSRLGMEQVLDIVWHNEPQFFIHLVPSQPPAKPWNFTDVKSMIEAARLLPLPLPRDYPSCFSAPNQFGAVVLNLRRLEDQNSAEQITQVSRYGEIWGIDKLSAVYDNKIQFGEIKIAQALKGYLSFARNQLRLTPPLTIMAGFTGVQGFEFHHPMKQHVWWNPAITHCNSPSILWQGDIADLNDEPKAVLLPFFDTVWDHCGLSRKDWFPEDYQ